MDVENEASLIPIITPDDYASLRTQKNNQGEPVIADGMVPKLTNALATIECGVQAVIIGNAMELKKLLSGAGGTTIQKTRI